MTVPSAKDARLLGDQLQQDPVRFANNAAKLLACLQDPLQEPAARAAIQGLKLFYVAQHDNGQISNKRQKLDPAAAAPAANASQQQQQQAPEQLYSTWLSRQYSSFVDALLSLLARPGVSASIQVAAVSAVMECVRHEAGPAVFSNRLYRQLLLTVLNSSSVQPEVFSLLVGKYLPYWDVRYYTLQVISKLAQHHAVRGSAAANGSTAAAANGSTAAAAAVTEPESDDDDQQQHSSSQRSPSDVSRAMFDLLSHVTAIVPPPAAADKQQQQQQQGPEVQSWCGSAEAGLVTAAADAAVSAKARRKRKQQEADHTGSSSSSTAVAWANAKVQQRMFGDAWLAFLRTDLPGDIYRKVLIKLHSDVLPAMTNPLLLSDFLTHALDQGGFEGMLALNGIFRLVTRHGLEYPGFYARLYGLITPAAFLHKHRVQFFQLADIFLASGMVPAYTAAAFAKKIARLALKAPPAGAMVAIGFIHNIVRRHPACMVMLHRPQVAAAAETQVANGAAAAAAGGQGVDVYNESEPDPAKSRAVESSLWELAALRNHYCPQVANMCSVLDKDLSDRIRTSELDIQPLLPTSYSSLMAQELGKKLRKSVPVAFYKTLPQGLWDAGLVGDDLQGWDLSAPDAGS